MVDQQLQGVSAVHAVRALMMNRESMVEYYLPMAKKANNNNNNNNNSSEGNAEDAQKKKERRESNRLLVEKAKEKRRAAEEESLESIRRFAAAITHITDGRVEE